MRTYFEPTANMQLRPDEISYVPRAHLTDSDSLQRFELIGKMIGWAIRNSRAFIALDLNVVFWRKLFGMPLRLEQLNQVDYVRYQWLNTILSGEMDGMQAFEADLGDGKLTELKPKGADSMVTPETR